MDPIYLMYIKYSFLLNFLAKFNACAISFIHLFSLPTQIVMPWCIILSDLSQKVLYKFSIWEK